MTYEVGETILLDNGNVLIAYSFSVILKLMAVTFKKIFLLDGLFMLLWLVGTGTDVYAKYVIGIGYEGVIWSPVAISANSLSLALSLFGLHLFCFRGFSMDRTKPVANAILAGWDAPIVYASLSRLAINLTANSTIFGLGLVLPIGNIFVPLAIVVGLASALMIPKFVLNPSFDTSKFDKVFFNKTVLVAFVGFALGPLARGKFGGDLTFLFGLAMVTCTVFVAGLWYYIQKKERTAIESA